MREQVQSAEFSTEIAQSGVDMLKKKVDDMEKARQVKEAEMEAKIRELSEELKNAATPGAAAAATDNIPLSHGLYLSGLNEITYVLKEKRKTDPVLVLYKLLGFYYLGGSIRRHVILRGSPDAPNNAAIIYCHSIALRNAVARAIRSFARERNTESVFVRDLFHDDQLPLARLMRAYAATLKEAGACVAFRVVSDNGTAVLQLLKDPKGSFAPATPGDMAGFEAHKEATESAEAETADRSGGTQSPGSQRAKSGPKRPPPVTGANAAPVRQKSQGGTRPKGQTASTAGGSSSAGQGAIPRPPRRQQQELARQQSGPFLAISDNSGASVGSAEQGRLMLEMQMRSAMANAMQIFNQSVMAMSPTPFTTAFLNQHGEEGDMETDSDSMARELAGERANARKRQ